MTVVVRIKAKPGMVPLVKQELLDLLAPTRDEDGCINYDMHQAVADDSLFLFHENWTSKRRMAGCVSASGWRCRDARGSA